MANKTQNSLALKAAKPTVRLKGKDQEYGETQEYETFKSRGGKDEDLHDEERWLRHPNTASSSPWEMTKLDFCLDDCDIATQNNDVSKARGYTITDQKQRSDKILIWNPIKPKGTSETVRLPTEHHLAFHLLPRACISGPEDVVKKALESIWDTSTPLQPALERSIEAVFIGISAINLQPVFMVRNDSEFDAGTALYEDNVQSVSLATLLSQTTCKKETIWLESMLIPGNIAYIKRALWGHLEKNEKERFLRAMKREHEILTKGWNPSGVANVLPSHEASAGKPVLGRPVHLSHGVKTHYNLHYNLRWPPMAVLEFPPDMITEMQKFLDKFPHDNIPLNLALAATVIYFDLKNSNWQKEGFLPSSSTNGPSKATLAQFIIYFPHMLRFVELKHLTAFIHPSRFATLNARLDFNPQFSINSKEINLSQMGVWCSQIRSRYPQVPTSYRFDLIPASMPGTAMVFPEGCSSAQKPNADLFTICCLNDVRTLGIPSYECYDAKGAGAYLKVGGPRQLFSRSVDPHVGTLHGVPSVRYWKPMSHPRVMALTGPARSISPVLPDVGSDYFKSQGVKQCVDRLFGTAKSYTQNLPLCESLGEFERNEIAARGNQLKNILLYLGKDYSEWEISPNTHVPAWQGMEDDINNLQEKGELERVASGELKRPAPDSRPVPPPKRAKTEEPLLQHVVSSQILNLISGLTAVSYDWGPLSTHLREAPSCTVKTVQELFSHVQLVGG